MRTRTLSHLLHGYRLLSILGCLLAVTENPVLATDYTFNLTTGTGAWSTSTIWTPNGIPTLNDNIDYAVNGVSSVNLTVGGVSRTVNAITKTGTQRWDIIGQSATLSTLNAQSLTIGVTNMIFRDGSSGGGLQVNLGTINLTAGTLFFGSTSLSTANLLRGLSVSGTTNVSGGALMVNVDNATDSYSLGLLNVSGAGTVSLNNSPAGKGATTGNVAGLNGTAGFIQVAPNVGQNSNTATLAITNTIDYSSATVIRDSATTSLYGTLSLSKAGGATQTLTGANTFTGATSVTNGTLKMGTVAALGGRSGIAANNTDNGTHVSGTGTLDLAGQTSVVEVIRLNGHGLGGNGALINSGVAASIANGVAMITQTTGGTGTAQTLTLSGGGGTGATATVSMGVTSTTFTINGGTTVYSVAPTVTISGGGASTAAVATANLTGGVVTSITITGAGAGYTTAPNISFSGGTVTTAGTNPTGTGNAANFTPVNYTITNVGSDYTSAPSISFSSGPFAATAALSGIVLMGDSSIGGSGDILVSGVVSESGGSRSLTKAGGNILTLANSGNNYSGATIINGGAISIVTDSALGAPPGAATPAHLTFNTGTLTTSADLTLNSNRGIFLGAGGGTLNVTSPLLTYSGIIDGAGSLTKIGSGKMVLSGPSTYTGATFINTGTLAISNSTALGTAAGGVTVANLATLELSGGITVGAEPLSLTGDGATANLGALQNLSGNNTWGGNIDVTAGATRINSDAGTLLITGNVTTNGTGNFNVGGGGDIEISGVISGPLLLFKSSVGVGTLTLSNPNNTYTGHTTIANGTVRISSEGNLGATPESFSSIKIRIRGGTLQTTADMSISANRGITISNGGGAISTDTGTTLTVNSRISGTVATDLFIKAGGGTLVLAGASTYIGPTQVNAGTLMVTNTTGSGTGTGALNVTSGTLAGNHTGAGNITGAVTTATGSFISPGSDTSSATHGVGLLKITSLDLQSGSTGRFNIDGATAFDRIDISATDGLILNGRLTITTELSGPELDTAFAMGTSFDLLDWAGVLGGSFDVGGNFRDGSADDSSQFDLPNLAALGRGWDVSQFLTNGSILVVPEPSRLLLLAFGILLLFNSRRRPLPPLRSI